MHTKSAKICVSIKVANIKSLKSQLVNAKELGAQIFELRLDYLPEIRINKLGEILGNYSKQCIFTLRPRWEGGFFNGTEKERLATFYQLLDLKPGYIDIELKSISKSIVKDLIESNTEITKIVSQHNFVSTPDFQLLERSAKRALKIGNIAKIVTTAIKFRDNVTALKLIKHFPKGKIISFCMGELGLITRILSPLIGAPFTYAALDKNSIVSKGQVTTQEMIDIYETIRI